MGSSLWTLTSMKALSILTLAIAVSTEAGPQLLYNYPAFTTYTLPLVYNTPLVYKAGGSGNSLLLEVLLGPRLDLPTDPAFASRPQTDFCAIQDVTQCPIEGADIYHQVTRLTHWDNQAGRVKAANLFGENLADFLATQVNAMDKEGNYNFTNAKYGFDPYVLNQGGCNNGASGLYPHGAVITRTQAILDGGYQFRYYDLEMTKDDGKFLLKALEVVGTHAKDGSRSLIICRCEVDEREAGKDFCEDMRYTLEKRFEFMDCFFQKKQTKNTASYCKERVYGSKVAHLYNY